MKILLINQTFYPEQFATSQQVTDLALFLKERGHTVTVYTGRRGYEDRRKIFAKQETWNGISIHRIHSTGFGKTSVLKRILDSLTFDLMLLVKLLFSAKFDLVVSFTSPPLVGVLGAIFCLFKGGRSVQWLMDVNPDAAFEVGYLERHSPVGFFLNAVFEWTLKRSANVVVLDRWMKERIVLHGAQPEKIAIIPPWSVLEKTVKEPPKATGLFRKENQLQDKFLILYSGNHSVVHPLDTLLKAALELKNHTEIQFVFAGSGLRTKDVAAFKEKHRLENITQLPWQSREALRDSFVSVDLHVVVMGKNVSGLVHTSKIYSILSSGRPYLFIGPEESHVVDLLKECAGGMHVLHEDVSGLAQKILAFKRLSEAEKAEMGKRNVEYLASHFGHMLSKSKFESEVVFSRLTETSSPLSKKRPLHDSP